MRKRIQLPNRDSSRNYLVYHDCKDGLYEFVFKGSYRTLQVTRDKNMIVAVDPPGGPMMAIGDKTLITGMALHKIDFVKDIGCVLYFKSLGHATSSSK